LRTFLFPCVADLISLLCYLGKGFTVCSTSASKYYLDLDIPEVHEFRARCILSEFDDLYFLDRYISPVLTVLCLCSLMDPHKSILLLPCQLQNPVNPSHLVKNWRTIKQLKNLNPHELQVTWCTVVRFKPYVSVTYLSFLLVAGHHIFVQSYLERHRLHQRLVLSVMLPLQKFDQWRWNQFLLHSRLSG